MCVKIYIMNIKISQATIKTGAAHWDWQEWIID